MAIPYKTAITKSREVIMEEQWKPIPTWEDKYEVSSEGRIWSKARHIFKRPDVNNAGYLRIQLCRNGHKERLFVHRLVAELFVPGKFADFIVNHIDGNKLNNSAQNLEWISPSDSVKHSLYELDNAKTAKHFAKQPYKLIHADKTVTYYEDMQALSFATGLAKSVLYQCLISHDGWLPLLNGTIARCESNDYPR